MKLLRTLLKKFFSASKIVYDFWATNHLLFTCCFFICHRIITEIDLIIIVEGNHINFMSLRIINQSTFNTEYFFFNSSLTSLSSYPTVFDPYHWIIVCLLFHFNFVLFTWKATSIFYNNNNLLWSWINVCLLTYSDNFVDT